MLRRLRDEQGGAVMVLAAISFTVLLLFAGLALDFGRAHLLKSQLQTALDAAALSGALQVIPMATIERRRWQSVDQTCTDPVSGQPYTCASWLTASPATATGTEAEVWKNNAGYRATAGQCTWPYRCGDPQVVRQWQILPPITTTRATETFRENARWPGGTQGATVTDMRVDVDPVKQEVTAAATMRMPTSFLRLVGIDSLTFTRTGSAQPTRLQGGS